MRQSKWCSRGHCRSPKSHVINESTLGNWVTKYRGEHPASEDLNISERARLKELEKEVRELRMEREFLKKAAAFFAKEQ
jgi:transposase